MFALGNLIFEHYALSLVIQESSEMFLARYPSLRFGHFPTPLEKHENLTKALDGSVPLFAYQHLFSKRPGSVE